MSTRSGPTWNLTTLDDQSVHVGPTRHRVMIGISSVSSLRLVGLCGHSPWFDANRTQQAGREERQDGLSRRATPCWPALLGNPTRCGRQFEPSCQRSDG